MSYHIKDKRMRISRSISPTNTVFARQVDLKAFIAGAFVCPQHVLTHSVLADVRVEGTLVNICKGEEHAVVRVGKNYLSPFGLHGVCLNSRETHAGMLVGITSSIAGYANTIGAQGQELSCNTMHKQHSLVDKKKK